MDTTFLNASIPAPLAADFQPRSLTPLVLSQGRILDPASGRDLVGDLLIEEGLITRMGRKTKVPKGARVVDCQGKWVVPGLIDLHVHLREPGFEHKESIESGAQAAAAGGFTTIVAMPNTQPVIDSPMGVTYVRLRAREVNLTRVLATAAITVGQLGERLSPMIQLKAAGAVGFTDDGRPVRDALMMRRALEYASQTGLAVMSHAEDLSLSAQGHMHEGAHSCAAGLSGIPSASEEICVARDLILAGLTGGRLHLMHLSAAGSIEAVRAAKARGLHVTCEVTPHHFSLTDEAVMRLGANAKMNPPLRASGDIAALLEGMRDGTVDAIATDHAPHTAAEKSCTLDAAPFGVVGLETALPLTLELVRRELLTPMRAIELFTTGPARVLNMPLGTLAEGALADVTVIDPLQRYTLSTLQSRSHNSPFLDIPLQGRALMTIVAGQIVYSL